MPKRKPEPPWPLSRDELERQATADLAKLLQAHPERAADLGKPSNLPKFILAYEFYREQGFPRVEVGSHLKGIDFNKPVDIITMPPPKLLSQWQIPALGTEAPRVGCYWMLPRASTPRSLGINPEGPRFDPDKGRPSSRVMMRRTEFNFMCSDDTPPMSVLRSMAAPIIDDWTDPSNPRTVYGGGQQHFSNELGDYYKPTHDYQLGRQWLRGAKYEVLPPMDQKEEFNAEVAASMRSMQSVLQKLNLAQLAILDYQNDSDARIVIDQLSELAQEAEKAANEANKLATSLQLAVDQQMSATPSQKYAAAQAMYYAEIAGKDLKEIENLHIKFERAHKKDQKPDSRLQTPFLDLQGKQKYTPLPMIKPNQKEKPITPRAFPSPPIEEKKRHALLPPLSTESSIRKHREFKEKVFQERVKKEVENFHGKTNLPKPFG